MIPFHPQAVVAGVYRNVLFALDKAPGLMAHPNKPGIAKNAVVLAPYDEKEECYLCEDENGEIQKVYLLNRLDSPTSGLILLTPDLAIAEHVRAMFREKRIEKKYYAIVRNQQFEDEKGKWEDPFETQGNAAQTFVRSRTRSDENAKGRTAVTAFRCLERDKRKLNLALIELTPRTGFTHQLRVQCVKHRHPIVGDKTYGDFAFNKRLRDTLGFDRLALHAAQIAVPMEEGRVFTVRSSLPDDFRKLLG